MINLVEGKKCQINDDIGVISRAIAFSNDLPFFQPRYRMRTEPAKSDLGSELPDIASKAQFVLAVLKVDFGFTVAFLLASKQSIELYPSHLVILSLLLYGLFF